MFLFLGWGIIIWFGYRLEKVELGLAEPKFPFREYIKVKIPKECKGREGGSERCREVYERYEEEWRNLCLERYYLTENPDQNLKSLCQYFPNEWIEKIPTKRRLEETFALFIEKLEQDNILGACEYINPIRREEECEWLNIAKNEGIFELFIEQLKKANPTRELKENDTVISYQYIFINKEGISQKTFIEFIKDIHGNWLIDTF